MTESPRRLSEVLQYFFRLGIVAFGGPAAHIAMMQRDLVDQRKWLDSSTFLDYVGATSLIPGPNSTEMTMHCGMHRAGVKGLFAGGIAFILPAVTITLFIAISIGYVQHFQAFEPIMDGVKAVVIAIIVGAIWKLGQKAIKNLALFILALGVVAACWFGISEILCILGAGILGLVAYFAYHATQNFNGIAIPLFFFLNINIETSKIFLIFLKIGSILFGSGYVLFAYLDGELIQNLGWLTHAQLTEAVAIGQITPGPVLSTSTYIGYQLDGIAGAVAATCGIFLPSFLFVLLLNPLIPKMRKSKPLSWFLLAVNCAAVSVMVVVVIYMTKDVVTDWKTLFIGGLGFVLYFGFPKLSSIWIVLAGAAAGFFLQFL